MDTDIISDNYETTKTLCVKHCTRIFWSHAEYAKCAEAASKGVLAAPPGCPPLSHTNLTKSSSLARACHPGNTTEYEAKGEV